MLKILIVDDEPDICALINKLIDWEGLNLTSLGSSLNGIEAMEIILRQSPDVVITDIQMPGMTGLEMIEKVTEMQLPVNFIVISGYSEFEYAQQALRFNVKDYLLKPISKTDLNLVLKRLAQDRMTQNEKEQKTAALENEYQNRTALLRRNELRQSITDPMRNTFNTDLFSFGDGEFLALTIHASFREKTGIDLQTIQNVLTSIAGRVQDHFLKDCFDIEYSVNDCSAVVLMNYSPETHRSYKEKRKKLQIMLDEYCIQYRHLCISMALGCVCKKPQEIGTVLHTSESASRMRLLTGTDKVIEFIEHTQRYPVPSFAREGLRNIAASVESLNTPASLVQLYAILDAIEERKSYAEFSFFDVIASALIFIKEEISAYTGQEPAEINNSLIHIRLANCDTMKDIRDCCRDVIDGLSKHCREVQESRVSKPVRIAQEYIGSHLNQQISLDEIAQKAFVSPSYLSTLFKEQTGENFMDYIIRQRINEAKRLLRTTGMSVSDVASSVGYADPRHFSKVFQKQVGMKPSEYRDFYS